MTAAVAVAAAAAAAVAAAVTMAVSATRAVNMHAYTQSYEYYVYNGINKDMYAYSNSLCSVHSANVRSVTERSE